MLAAACKRLPIKKKLLNYLYLCTFIFFSFVYDLKLWVIEVSDISFILFVVLFAIGSRNKKKERKILSFFKPVIISFNIFCIWCLITQLFACEYIDSANAVVNMFLKLVKWYVYSFVFLGMAYGYVRKSKSFQYMFYGVVIGLSLQFLVSVYATHFNHALLHAVPKGDNFGLMKLSVISSKNPHGNLIACYLIFLIQYYAKIKKNVLLIPITLLSLGLIGLLSRGAWISFVLGIILMIGTKKYRKTGITLIVFIMIIAMNVPLVINRLKPTESEKRRNTETGLRLELILNYVQNELNVNDIFVGKGYYARFYRSDMWPYGVHNHFIQIFWETGLIGLVLFLNIYLQLWKKMKQISSRETRKMMGIVLFVELFCLNSEIFLYSPMFLGAQIILTLYMIFYVMDIENVNNNKCVSNDKLLTAST